MAKQTCRTCRFWEEDKSLGDVVGQEAGLCLRFPPVRTSENFVSIFPITYDLSWCGEWKPRPEKKLSHE